MRSRLFAQRSAASGRYSVEPNASSAMNSCGVERSKRFSTCSGRVRLVHLPALGQQREAEHPRDRGLAHLGRAGEDEEVVRLEDRRRRGSRPAWARTRARARAWRRCRTSSARSASRVGRRGVEREDRRQLHPQRGQPPDRVAQLVLAVDDVARQRAVGERDDRLEARAAASRPGRRGYHWQRISTGGASVRPLRCSSSSQTTSRHRSAEPSHRVGSTPASASSTSSQRRSNCSHPSSSRPGMHEVCLVWRH